MKAIRLQVTITLDDEAVIAITELLNPRERPNNRPQEPMKVPRPPAPQTAPHDNQRRTPDQVLLIDTNQAAKVLKVSARTIWKMDHAGEMPASVRIGRVVRWSYEELQAWTNAGCPPRSEWEHRKAKLQNPTPPLNPV